MFLYSDMTSFVGFWLSKFVVIRACSKFSHISVKWNNIDTNKPVAINYQQFLLYSEIKVIIYRKLVIQLDTRCSVSSHRGIPLSVIQEKILIAKVHKDMKLNVRL